jgi:hypothetical protein
VLFEKFIEQHRVDLLIANGFGLAFRGAAYQIGIHFRYFFCDETKGYGLGGVVLRMIPEAHWSERVDRFTSGVHRTDVVFVSTRRDIRPTKSTVAVCGNEIWVRSDLRLNIGINLADIAAVAHVLTTDADGNHVVGGSHATADSSTQGCVESSTGIDREGKDAAGCVAGASSVGKKRPVTICRVVLAVGIITERFKAGCCVDITGRVAKERFYADGGVTEAGSIAAERERAGNCVFVTSGVVRERFSSGGSVVVTGRVATQRKSPLVVFRIPVVLSPRADDPLAVLKLPVVLFASAAAPVAVFWPPVVLLLSA